MNSEQEARLLFAHGFKDVLIGTPLDVSKVDVLLEMALEVLHELRLGIHQVHLCQHPEMKLLVDNRGSFDYLLGRMSLQSKPLESLGIFIKVCARRITCDFCVSRAQVDCGYHRAGVDPSDPDSIALAKAIVAGMPTHTFMVFEAPLLVPRLVLFLLVTCIDRRSPDPARCSLIACAVLCCAPMAQGLGRTCVAYTATPATPTTALVSYRKMYKQQRVRLRPLNAP